MISSRTTPQIQLFQLQDYVDNGQINAVYATYPDPKGTTSRYYNLVFHISVPFSVELDFVLVTQKNMVRAFKTLDSIFKLVLSFGINEFVVVHEAIYYAEHAAKR